MQKFAIHEAADLFPLDEEHIDELAADIKANGQQVPIELLDGKIIDGRRRFTACQRLGIDAQTKVVRVPDPIQYVLSLNLHRRHLTPSQLSMVAARVRSIYDRQAKERMESGKRNPVANLPQGGEGKARDLAGKAVGVSGKSVDYATRVLERGTPELVKAVDEGRVAVSTAAIHASDSPEDQREFINRVPNRNYISCSKSPEDKRETPEAKAKANDNGEIKLIGVGVIRANEAINSLTRIPKNDALRQRGLQLVMDWCRRNK